jgi:hypothetical protein
MVSHLEETGDSLPTASPKMLLVPLYFIELFLEILYFFIFLLTFSFQLLYFLSVQIIFVMYR